MHASRYCIYHFTIFTSIHKIVVRNPPITEDNVLDIGTLLLNEVQKNYPTTPYIHFEEEEEEEEIEKSGEEILEKEEIPIEEAKKNLLASFLEEARKSRKPAKHVEQKRRLI